MRKVTREERLARELARNARKAGRLLVSELDGYLDIQRGFDRRVDCLIQALGDLSLERDPVEAGASPLESSRGLGLVGDDGLRRYLRQVGGRRRMDKDREIRLARRLEFTRRRFERAAQVARLRGEHLREVLGPEFSRSYARDLDLPEGGRGRRSATSLAVSRRLRVRSRAMELNEVRAEFVEGNLGLVVDISLGYRTYGVPLMDLVQEGNGALIRAVEKFDWRKNVRFQTYATFWVRQAVERSIAFNKGIVRVPNYLQQKMRRLRREGVLPRRDRDVSVAEVSEAFAVKAEVAGHLLETERTHYSLDVTVDEDGETFASMLADEGDAFDFRGMEFPLLRRRLEECLGTLSELEQEILRLRFGLDGSDPMTLEEVGQRMSVSRERIRQLQVRAIRKLQRPTLLQRLHGFV